MASPAKTQATIPNRLGLHARPAMSFVDLAAEYNSVIRVRRADSDEFVDAKSIMQVMMLAATKGTILVIEAQGDDAQQACEALRKLIDAGFGED